MTFLPFFTVCFFYLAIGGNPKGLKIGIVDNEISSYQDCTDSSLITTFVHDGVCNLHKVSCRFLNSFDDSLAEKIFYQTHDEAYKDARKGNIIGIIEMASNFTESLMQFQISREPGDIDIENSRFIVELDQTDQMKTLFIQRKLYDAYQKYSEEMSTDCGSPKRLDSSPVNFHDPIYGKLEAELVHMMAPAMIMVMLFFMAAAVLVTVIIQDRKEGFWNRTLLAGVTASEMMVAQVSVNSFVLFLQILEVVVLVAFVFGTVSLGPYYLIVIIVTLNGFAGMFFGLLLSCLCDDLVQATLLMIGISQPMLILAGIKEPNFA